MKKKNLMTVDDLIKFCFDHQFYSFNSEETGHQLFVRIPATFEKYKDDEFTMYGKVKLLHDGKNRNKSILPTEVIEKCKKKLSYKPLLANFCEIDGVEDFTSHDMEIDEDGNVNYIERQIGCFTSDEPYLEYDKEKDRNYLYAYVAIPKMYTHAADIIERKGGTKISAELSVSKMSYDAENKAITFDEVEITGATCLGVDPDTGEEIREGMEGANLDISNFSESSMVDYDIDQEFLDSNINAFSINNSEEGGKPMINELLEKYGKTIEEITFEYENMNDEELAVAFEDAFGEKPEYEVEHTNFSAIITLGENTKTFGVNLSDVIYALSELVNTVYAEDGTYYGVDVFSGSTNKERYVIMHNLWGDDSYKQNYKEKDGNYSLTGERVRVYNVWLTAEEKADLEAMKANYAEVTDKLAKYEAEPSKMEVLDSECFGQIANEDEFVELKNNHFDMSLEDVQKKADEILLSFAKQNNVKPTVTALPTAGQKKVKENKYGNLFQN